jgi:putative Mg2+ transporter-C (MgtC) family protein
MINDFLEFEDVYKALFSIGAGIILGLERELKDKKAGLKTISIICLGATLFSLKSKKVGGDANAGQIAAYIVSGVGFIGAGAIFKDGSTISGLTTAGII